ncbi:TPT-domain-containing protein [Cystobasidium minutum MCA 4210]|uniref:TPT-domain-containing protein n=1 Tax=Cystobasidium minutum MCA 4210 TaxID=1397322 RepID=UPI0034CFBD58|eukprot:jgi/Rhomi1/142939/e_gw1.3.1030.1
MGPPPGRGYYKHKVIPSLTSSVPPVLAGSRPKGWSANTPTTANATSTSSSTSSLISKWDSPQAWIVYYFIANLSLTLYNKLLMNRFPFAWTLTAVHALSGCIGAQFCLSRGFFTQQRLTTRENLVLISFSSLYTINIAVSNLSLNLVTVPFHQVVRAMTPLFTIILATIFLRKRSSRATWLSLIPVVAGVVFATYGDYYFTTWGLILTLLGTLLAAMKTLATNMILVGRLKLHPLDLLIRMSPLAFAQCLFASWWTGELAKVQEFTMREMTYAGLFGLLMNGVIAFFLNVVSFTANKKTSALTMTVAANVKQVLTIVLAVMIFHLKINLTNFFGITLTLLGGALYAKVELDQKNARALANSPANGNAPNPAGPVGLTSVVEEKMNA